MGKNFASIDIGTHTARVLIGQKLGPPGLLRPIFRERTYIRLGEGFDHSGRKTIHSHAITRTVKALQDFLRYMKDFNVHKVLAVATGVVREASNRELFLGSIRQNTGFEVRPIGGDEEALLTGKGVLHALGVQKDPFVIFDLGGGSTEFLFGGRHAPEVRSIPIGAVTLTQEHLESDPPDEKELSFLSGYIDKSLKGLHLLSSQGRDNCPADCLLIGTGGTVTTLAAMLHGILPQEIGPERINGLILEGSDIGALFDKMSKLSVEERLRLPGLDPGRAGVILAGALVVLRVLYFLRLSQMVVSLSDLLEGILINYFEGEEHE